MDEGELSEAHKRLLDQIEAEARETAVWTGRERFAERVMTAMARVPRHEFVRPQDVDLAYVNRPQGIGHGQTISQPYIVAVMTELLDLDPSDKVLEVGTGSGYQAAVLAEIAQKVFSIESVRELAEGARERLKRLGYENVEVRVGSGFDGWPEEAPFDAIIVTAAPRDIPEALARQLKAGGRMVIPIGRAHETQTLCRCTKDETGELHTKRTLPVAFVPMVERTRR